jgi:hypothetical protein
LVYEESGKAFINLFGMRNLIYLLICFFLLLSCKKNSEGNNEFDSGSILETSGSFIIEKPVLLTRNSSDTNIQHINDFLVRHHVSTPAFIFTQDSLPEFFPIKVEFSSPERAIVTEHYPGLIKTEFVKVVENSDSLLLLHSVDTAEVTEGNMNSCFSYNCFKNLKYFDCIWFPNSFLPRCKTVKEYLIQKINGELSIPFLNCLAAKGEYRSVQYCHFGRTRVITLFDNNVLSQLGPNDTLFVQRSKVKITKL